MSRPALVTRSGKRGILGQKSITRVHGLGAGRLGGHQDRGLIEIAFACRRGRPDADGDVRAANISEHRDRLSE